MEQEDKLNKIDLEIQKGNAITTEDLNMLWDYKLGSNDD